MIDGNDMIVHPPVQDVPLTATGVQEMNNAYWKRMEPILQRRGIALKECLMDSLFDKLLRIVLKHEGRSYRKFMFNRVKLNIE